jgi:hypothetical protein
MVQQFWVRRDAAASTRRPATANSESAAAAVQWAAAHQEALLAIIFA